MRVAGYDISYAKGRDEAVACLSIFEDGQLTEEHVAEVEPGFDYVPGQLWRREKVGLEALLPRLSRPIDALVIDGNGTIHPQRFGAANEYSRLFDLRAIGCAKSLFVGAFKAPAEAALSRSPVMLDGERVGTALRAAAGVKPVFISTGCDLSQDEAVAIIEPFCGRYRIPEITRRPDIRSRERLRELARS